MPRIYLTDYLDTPAAILMLVGQPGHAYIDYLLVIHNTKNKHWNKN